ncbi:LysR family transcriptional regulator ArgP [Streptacidiphilus jiangxiensis]|uniref:HTH-type transcriptional regulator LysG n=1 Tax=Streptacidiphilus jiangxiensis TaxID=235985 RepID=A0A1H7YME4_STRJI|nr:LysR family transcriptional regulator ArgP [Streptacidiphilus jiangxiensis]SEM46339.1 LysR family transcriptional regulator, chromosome initiation inhibitor [Streptacidiphilus jiangxiensis]
MKNELPHDLVRTLLAVVDEGTFDAAAAVLHVTPSAVSQRVKALEQRAGRVLLTRTRPVRATESGQVVVRYARQLARLEGDARTALGMDEAARDGDGDEAAAPTWLAVAVNADSLATWFVPALAALADDARIHVDLRREDEAHTTALLREGEVMAAVTSSSDPVAGCSVHPLGAMRYLPVAAPAFAARWLTGDPARWIPRAPVVCFDRRDDLQDALARELTHGRPASRLRHYVPSSEGFADAVTAGLGWGLVPEGQARAGLADGRLVEILPGRTVEVPLFWQQWRLDSPALATLASLVTAAAARALTPPPGRKRRAASTK